MTKRVPAVHQPSGALRLFDVPGSSQDYAPRSIDRQHPMPVVGRGRLDKVILLDNNSVEARLAFGPGYRVYLGKGGPELVLLLLGGDKGSQTEDIKRAREYWAKYLKETRDGKTK
jgi:putative addiction module killer protein